MIDTILAIGKAISQDRDPWEDIVATIELDTKGGKLTPLRLNLVFDLDTKRIELDIQEVDGTFAAMKRVGSLRVKGGNNKAHYLAVPGNKLSQLEKTLFGKPDAEEGEMVSIMRLRHPQLLESELYAVLTAIYPLRQQFLACFEDDKGSGTAAAARKLSLGKQSKIEVLVAWVKWEEKGITQQPLAQVAGFRELIEGEYFAKQEPTPAENVKHEQPSLDYATGEATAEVVPPKFAGRYNVNKFFVQETANYASLFDKKRYGHNYQVSPESEVFLNRGSDLLLKEYTVRIAGLAHVIVPKLLLPKRETYPIERLRPIQQYAEWVFSARQLKDFNLSMAKEAQYYWLNFLAIDSDGNYFKVANHIKDVPMLHLLAVGKALEAAAKPLAPWLGEAYARSFNLGRMFFEIPIRKDQKQNQALDLFSAILEQRPVRAERIFDHFVELILCHWHSRYKAYANVSEPKGDLPFDLSAKNAVFKYLAFLQALRQLRLLQPTPKMDIQPTSSQVSSEQDTGLIRFFEANDYRDTHRAMFYLGRALQAVANAQYHKGINKTVLNKLNYNGMDRRRILLLSNELMEKGVQYGTFISKKNGKERKPLSGIEPNIRKFNQHFSANEEKWTLNPQEALFFILSGYTYGIKARSINQEDTDDSSETTEQN